MCLDWISIRRERADRQVNVLLASAFWLYGFLSGWHSVVLVIHVPGIACPGLDLSCIANVLTPMAMLLLLWCSGVWVLVVVSSFSSFPRFYCCSCIGGASFVVW